MILHLTTGDELLRKTITGNGATKILDFRYDQTGAPYSLTYTVGSTSTVYYYVTNLQGDVMYLVDSSGNQVAAYTYDPYGKVLTATGTMAEINPLRYRGYYQDSETGFYYLQSRYYDPAICRFINADSYASTGQGLVGYNAFAYCLNNPIAYADSIGTTAIEVVGIILIGVIVVIGCIATAHCVATAVTSMVDLLLQKISSARANARLTTQSTLPQQGLVEGDPEAPPVDAGKQGKHVPGHNNYDKGKSSWPEGQTGVEQTQEAWKNGVADPKHPDGSVRIGTASDGTTVRVHIDKKGAIHGYPCTKFFMVDFS